MRERYGIPDAAPYTAYPDFLVRFLLSEFTKRQANVMLTVLSDDVWVWVGGDADTLRSRVIDGSVVADLALGDSTQSGKVYAALRQIAARGALGFEKLSGYGAGARVDVEPLLAAARAWAGYPPASEPDARSATAGRSIVQERTNVRPGADEPRSPTSSTAGRAIGSNRSQDEREPGSASPVLVPTSPPSPSRGGDGQAPNESSPMAVARIRPRDRSRFEAKLDYLVRCGHRRAQERARHLRAANRADPFPDSQIAELLAETDFQGVTPTRLANFRRNG